MVTMQNISGCCFCFSDSTSNNVVLGEGCIPQSKFLVTSAMHVICHPFINLFKTANKLLQTQTIRKSFFRMHKNSITLQRRHPIYGYCHSVQIPLSVFVTVFLRLYWPSSHNLFVLISLSFSAVLWTNLTPSICSMNI